MKKFLKRTLLAILLIPCLVVFSGCWNDDKENDNKVKEEENKTVEWFSADQLEALNLTGVPEPSEFVIESKSYDDVAVAGIYDKKAKVVLTEYTKEKFLTYAEALYSYGFNKNLLESVAPTYDNSMIFTDGTTNVKFSAYKFGVGYSVSASLVYSNNQLELTFLLKNS